jgi:spore coat protein CotF
MGVEEGEEIQTEGIDNLLNRTIAMKFLNLKKEGVTQLQKPYRTSNR